MLLLGMLETTYLHSWRARPRVCCVRRRRSAVGRHSSRNNLIVRVMRQPPTPKTQETQCFAHTTPQHNADRRPPITAPTASMTIRRDSEGWGHCAPTAESLLRHLTSPNGEL